MDVLTSEICWALNKVIIKQVASSWSLFTQLTYTFMISRWIFLRMRNVSVKSCREYQNTYFMLNNFFSENLPFMRPRGKIWYSQPGRKWRYNTAHALCSLGNCGYAFAWLKVATRMRLNLTFIHTLPLLLPSGIYVWNSLTLCLHSSSLPNVLHSSPFLSICLS